MHILIFFIKFALFSAQLICCRVKSISFLSLASQPVLVVVPKESKVTACRDSKPRQGRRAFKNGCLRKIFHFLPIFFELSVRWWVLSFCERTQNTLMACCCYVWRWFSTTNRPGMSSIIHGTEWLFANSPGLGLGRWSPVMVPFSTWDDGLSWGGRGYDDDDDKWLPSCMLNTAGCCCLLGWAESCLHFQSSSSITSRSWKWWVQNVSWI